MSEQPLCIEFVGLAGAGKTTVAKEVIAQLNAANYRCVVGGAMGHRVVSGTSKTAHAGRDWQPRGKLDRWASYLLLHLRDWRLASGAYWYAIREGGGERNKLRLVRSLLHAAERIRNASRTVRAGYGDLILFDQGFLHFLRQIIATGNPPAEDKLRRLLIVVRDVILPTRLVLVVFKVDVETAVARIQQRPGMQGRYDRLSPERARAELAEQDAYTEQLIALLRELRGVEGLLRVEATKTPHENAALITEYILSQVSNHRRTNQEGSGAQIENLGATGSIPAGDVHEFITPARKQQ